MSSSGPGTGPSGRPVRGGAGRVILPIVLVPLGAGLIYNYFARGNAIKTPGMNNIEKAYSAGGAKATHTPGYGGTPRGNQTADKLSDNPNEQVGGKETFTKTNAQGQTSQGMEHRPVQPMGPGKTWNQAMYGNVDGK